MMTGLMLILWMVWIVLLTIGFVVNYRVERWNRDCVEVGLKGGMTGGEMAQRMLDDCGKSGVTVRRAKGGCGVERGALVLSGEVYGGRGVNAALMAIHECGYVVMGDGKWRLAKGLGMVVRGLNRLTPWLLLAGVLLSVMLPIFGFGKGAPLVGGALVIFDVAHGLLLVGFGLFVVSMVLSLGMLPMELRASRIGLAWWRGSGLEGAERSVDVERGLRYVAGRYVVATLTSMADLMLWMWEGIVWVWEWLT